MPARADEGRRPVAALWCFGALAFSPVLLELLRHLGQEPRDRYVLAAPLLLGLAWRYASGRSAAAGAPAALLLGLALLLELLGIAAGGWSIARLALALGVIGLGRFTGSLGLRAGLLAFAAVPLPSFVINLGTPALEAGLARLAAGLLGSVGIELDAAGPLLRAASERLELVPHDGGLPLAVVLGALGWYAGLRLGRGLGVSLRWTALGAAAAALLQPGWVTAAALLLWAGQVGAAEALLGYASWLLPLLVGLVAVERSARKESLTESPDVGRSDA